MWMGSSIVLDTIDFQNISLELFSRRSYTNRIAYFMILLFVTLKTENKKYDKVIRKQLQNFHVLTFSTVWVMESCQTNLIYNSISKF